MQLGWVAVQPDECTAEASQLCKWRRGVRDTACVTRWVAAWTKRHCYGTQALGFRPYDATLFSNRSAARLALGKGEEALEDAAQASRRISRVGCGGTR